MTEAEVPPMPGARERKVNRWRAEPPGSTPKPWAEGAQPTPAQALAWLRACTDEEGVEAVRRLMDGAAEASRCFVENHPGQVETLQAQLAAERARADGYIDLIRAAITHHLTEHPDCKHWETR